MTRRSHTIRTRRNALSGALAATLLTTGTFAVGAASPAVPLAQASATTPLAITVNVTDNTGIEIPDNFLGLSFEWSLKEAYFGTSSSNPNLATVRLLQNLGGGSIRIGGWSTDGYHYSPNYSSNFDDPFMGIYGPDAVRTILRVTSDAGWKATLGCSSTKDSPNLPWNDPTTIDPSLAASCRDMLDYATRDSGYGNALDAFEVGNERNANAPGGPSKAFPPAMTWDEYRKLFNTFGHVTAQNLHNDPQFRPVSMVGPATGGCNLDPTPNDGIAWLYNYCTTAGKPMSALATDQALGVTTIRINHLSYHFYPRGFETFKSDPGSEWIPAPPDNNRYIRDFNEDGIFDLHDILSEKIMESEQGQMGLAKTGAGTMPIRMSEGNSLNLGVSKAYPNIVDTQAAALWGTDYLFTAAQAGLAGVNFHSCRNGATQCTYNPFTAPTPTTVTAKPLYYGMYLFKYAAGTKMVSTTPSSTSDNIKVYATKDIKAIPTGKRYRVWVINKGGNTQAVTIHPNTPTASTGSLVKLIALNNDPGEKSLTIAGGTFDPSGTLQGFNAAPVTANASGDFTFSVPPYSASMLSVVL